MKLWLIDTGKITAIVEKTNKFDEHYKWPLVKIIKIFRNTGIYNNNQLYKYGEIPVDPEVLKYVVEEPNEILKEIL